MRLLRVTSASPMSRRPLLVYVPGMDCSGQCVGPQLPALLRAGFSVRALYIAPSDRSSWAQLVSQLAALLTAELQSPDVDGV
jgi:hypothetical protein